MGQVIMKYQFQLYLLCLLLKIACAQYGPSCRGKTAFAFVTCGTQCKPGINTPCPNQEIPVTQIDIAPNKPAVFNLGVKVQGFPLDVVFIIDGSPSMRPRLSSIKNEMVKLFRKIGKDLPSPQGPPRIGVVAYGGETSFDKTGYRMIQKLTENVDQAVEALDRIPITLDAPRSTLAALNTLSRDGRQLLGGLRGPRSVFVLIGDKAGREPNCMYSSSRDSTEGYLRSSEISLVAVNMGEPGLDAALPPVQPCKPGDSAAPVPANQASDLASKTFGASLNGFNAIKLWEVIDKTRRRDAFPYPPRSFISISKFISSVRSPIGPPPPPPYTGCKERVTITTERPLGLLSGPTNFDTKVTVATAPGACDNGTFTCNIQVLDSRVYSAMGGNLGGHGPVVFFDTIAVNACGEN